MQDPGSLAAPTANDEEDVADVKEATPRSPAKIAREEQWKPACGNSQRQKAAEKNFAEKGLVPENPKKAECARKKLLSRLQWKPAERKEEREDAVDKQRSP